MKQFFLIYTRLFDPFLVICAGYLIIFLKFGRLPKDLLLFFGIIAINIIIPIAYFLKLLKEKKVGNWDVTNKKQRRKIFGPLIFVLIISTILIFLCSDNSRVITTYLLQIQLAGIILFCYLFLISPFFKSSGHVGTMAVFYPFFLKIFGFEYFWIIILILLQGVARVKLKKHTIPEVIVGFVSGILIGLIASNTKI
jgi:hypothetical protein